MPETWQSTHTATFMQILSSLIRKDIRILRRIVAEGGDPEPAKEAMLEEIYRMGAKRAREIASETLKTVHEKLGFAAR